MSTKTVGDIIYELRKEKGFTRPEIVEKMEKIGVSISTNAYGKWETNLCKPSVTQFLALCQILGITNINDTFGIPGDSDPHLKNYKFLNEKGKKRVQEYIQLLSHEKKFLSSSV